MPLCLLTGLVFAGWLYARNRQLTELKPWLIRLLFVLRFFTIGTICFLLLSPFLKSSFREIEKPVIAIAVDNSSSMLNDSSKLNAEGINNMTDQLIRQLNDQYEVSRFSFGSRVVQHNQPNDFSDKSTGISDLFDYLKTLYSGRNLGAVILVSDGVYNTGSNPLYKAEALKVPVYTIATGDTVVNRDAYLSAISYNKVAYLGNRFPIEVGVSVKQANGANVVLTVREDSLTLFSRPLTVSSNNFYMNVPVLLQAATKGIHKYSLMISPVDGEKNIKNNQAEIYIDVQEKKLKILFLAQSPHPDIAAIKTVLDKTDLYETQILYADAAEPKFGDYNLIILHQLPSVKSTGLWPKIKASQVPYLLIGGTQLNINEFNRGETGVSISQSAQRMNEVYAINNTQFSLFSITDDFGSVISKLPPLTAPFGNYKTEKQINTLLTQRIGSLSTAMPLLYFSESAQVRTGVLIGEGIWRWRLNEFESRSNSNVTDELISKTVQYLITKERKAPFVVRYKRNSVEGENLVFDAALYNETGELVNEPELIMQIYNEQKAEFRFAFSRSNGAYQLNAGTLPPGRYSFKATCKLGDKTYSESGEFSVNPLLIENDETTANHQLLYTISKNTEGLMVSPSQTNLIIQDIGSNDMIKPVSYYHKKLVDLVSLKSLLIVLLCLISAEWLIRKISGIY